MKHLLKKLLLNSISLWATSTLLPGVSHHHSLQTIVLASAGLTLLNLALKPILKILFTPINLITLGLFHWLIPVIIVYLTTVLIPAYSVSGFTLKQLTILGITTPPLNFGLVSSLIITTFTINSSRKVIKWLLR